ncbi:MAG: CDP-diacylglycerol--glycerol-3-phosphate 3-phosphatidyltransferase [Lentisphaeria bacterium]|nr:CDP-diacylglycerol--glycerol-3-phosphate 3-phosphatidyltransferase [Lentisphaeria bacterium]MBO5765994.1 CDP-diacylglycerol--glycerol-3-phosphate 3-phosphatidyltransferase [Lentisphaeria bacterium]MBO7152174.1 CDP-diacylglycerol--glycerol-3-phosphate 3-phosphatidyltransferase [Lentisphaeria bacterium]
MSMKNIPNILTVSRIIAVVIFVILATLADYPFFQDKDCIFGIRLSAYILAVFAALTDLLDGYLARKYNQISDFGALMDPLADKIFVTGAMLILVEYRLMPAVVVFAVLSREFMVTGLRTLAAKKQVVISADRWGKLKTALQMTMLAIAGIPWFSGTDGIKCLRETVLGISIGGSIVGIRLWYVWLVFLFVIVLVTVLSGIGYFWRYRGLFLPEKKDE